ncbi:FAD-binding oxidoreductase [Chromobacterium vaccinii]|uniref:FAD-binding oxidoreductase n=1 Tax=Chromobacterium vaccinii TaxID=1108595 RepID=UPI000E20B732|nr:FAD-binding oxidoreductase [Chromobacterium vaccinii]
MPQPQMKKALQEGLRQICPCLDGADELQVHETDWRGRHFASALGVALPTAAEEVSQIVKFCRLRNIAIVAQGGIRVCVRVPCPSAVKVAGN